MQEPEFDTFAAMLQAVAEYHGKTLSPGVISIYWQGLRDLELAPLRQALNAHVQNPDSGQFMPKIADIRRMIGGTIKDAALMAWNKVTEGISRVGGYNSVCFDDPIINRVLIDMGGWPALCQKPEKELPFIEKNFCERYRAYRTRGGEVDHPRYLSGLSEADNSLRGFKSSPPYLVGNHEAAQRVLASGSATAMIPVSVGSHAGGVVLQLADKQGGES